MIFIPYNVPSLKTKRVAGKYRPKTVSKYLRQIGIRNYNSRKKIVTGYKEGLKTYRPNLFKEKIGDYFLNREYPIWLGLHFVRGNKKKADFNNLSHLICDLLTAHDFIEDDSMDYLLPIPLVLNNKVYSYDKEKPGVWLKILTNEIKYDTR